MKETENFTKITTRKTEKYLRLRYQQKMKKSSTWIFV